MTEFEFVFILYALLLGLSLIELVSGMGRALEWKFARDATGRDVKIGWLTPALAFFVMLDLLSFWLFAWVVRDMMNVTPLSLLAVMVFASSYYLAARLVFPTEPDNFVDLDTHYMRVKRLVMMILIALVGVQWAYLLFVLPSFEGLLTPLSVGITLVLVGLMTAVIIVRSPRWNLALLIILILRYLVVYSL